VSVVDGVVVLHAEGQEVAEVGRSAVLPPPDVVEVALIESDMAAGDGTGSVQGAQGAALSPVGEAGAASEVDLAGGVDDDAAADDDGVDLGDIEQAAEDLGGKLDREPPVHVRRAIRARAGGIHHDDDFGSPASAALGFGEGDKGVGLEEAVAFEGVGGAVLWDLFGEPGSHGGRQPAMEPEADFGVEAARQAPHAVTIDPGAEPGGSSLAFEAGHPIVGLDGADFNRHGLLKLVRSGPHGDRGNPVGPGGQVGAQAGFQLA
jgi:hypothetical protein